MPASILLARIVVAIVGLKKNETKEQPPVSKSGEKLLPRTRLERVASALFAGFFLANMAFKEASKESRRDLDNPSTSSSITTSSSTTTSNDKLTTDNRDTNNKEEVQEPDKRGDDVAKENITREKKEEPETKEEKTETKEAELKRKLEEVRRAFEPKTDVYHAQALMENKMNWRRNGTEKY